MSHRIDDTVLIPPAQPNHGDRDAVEIGGRVRVAGTDRRLVLPVPRPASERPTSVASHAIVRAAADADWRRWVSEPRNLRRTLEQVLGPDATSLQGATPEVLTRALDVVQQRYGIGTPNGPASLRDVVIARQRQLVGHGLSEAGVDGKIGSRTIEAEARFTRETGGPPGVLPVGLREHRALRGADDDWRGSSRRSARLPNADLQVDDATDPLATVASKPRAAAWLVAR